jgi:hypothetical protein
MRTVLKFAVLLQVVAGLYWTLSIAMTAGQGGLEVLYRFVLVFSLQTACFLLGLVALLKLPEHRHIARWSVGLPFLFYFLPGLLKAVLGGPVTGGMLVIVALAGVLAAIVISIVAPRKVALKLPVWLFTSRLFNGLILLAPLLGWLTFGAVLFWLLVVEAETTTRQLRDSGTGSGLGVAILMAASYLVGLGSASFVVASWGLLVLRSGVQEACRKLNVAQILLALPGLLAGGFAIYFLASQN